MSRIVPFMLTLVLLAGIAGCGNSEKPLDEKSAVKMTPEQEAKMKAGMEEQMKYHQKAQGQPAGGQPAGDGK